MKSPEVKAWIAVVTCLAAALTGSSLWADDATDVSGASDGKAAVSKQVIQPAATKWWDASITAEWDSLYMYRGVNSLQNSSKQYGSSIYSTTVDFTVNPTPNDSIVLGSWTGGGFTNAVYKEEDVSVTYNHNIGNLALSLGYELQVNMPSPLVLFQNELSAKAVYTVKLNDTFSITPSLAYYFDLGPKPNTSPGFGTGSNVYGGAVPVASSYLYPRIDLNIAPYKGIVGLNPFVGLGVNFGYNAKVNPNGTSSSFNGLNNVEIGLNVPITINSVISLNVYGEYSYAFAPLTGDYGAAVSPSTFWGGGSVTLAF